MEMVRLSSLVDRPRWIFKKHTNNFSDLIEYATYLKLNKAGISQDEKERMYIEFSKSHKYNPRISERKNPLDAINHKLDGLRYFMFGYYGIIQKEKKFIFSPLGNLYFKNLDNSSSLPKIFSTMLFGMQFPHIGSKPSFEFSLYPFRLIFKLLSDERLDFKIYHFEVETILMFVQNINKLKYEEIVREILLARKLTKEEKLNVLQENQYFYVNHVYQWEYYLSKILENNGIINTYENTEIGRLFHQQKPTSKSAPTSRKVTNGYFSLTDTIKPLIGKLLDTYSVFEIPLRLDNETSLTSDVIKEIYWFYPKELLEDIGEKTSKQEQGLLHLPKLIEEYSLNPENKTSDLFEDVLTEAFNLFENVEAEKKSGAGQTDIECLYLREPIESNEKFVVEAKSTAKKLMQVSAGRLKHHRSLLGAKYTILVTPRYAPSVKYDIEGHNIVIIKANTLSEYFYNYLVNGNRNINYSEIHTIVMDNLGKDITIAISELTLSRFA